jgi:hypothetical protein
VPYGSVKLTPGVNVETTPTVNAAGFQSSTLIRFRDALVQKYGGWSRFYPNAVAGVPRELHAWEDLNSTSHLAVGTTTQLAVITSGSLQDITPQTLTSNATPNFSTVSTTATVTVVDPNISNVTTYDAVFFNTPISVGGLILSGLYPVVSIVGVHSYTITAASNATASVNNVGAVPVFTTSSASAVVSVALVGHGLATGQQHAIVFQIPTTGNGVTISGGYSVTSVTDADNFTITVSTQANAGGSISMNTGLVQLLYYINIGPPAVGSGYGLGGYGSGGYGTGSTSTSQTGTEITATDWTSDNWGQILLACPSGGGVYQFDPTGGFSNAGLVSTAPIFNGGIFVSTSLQFLFCWASTNPAQIGTQQDPLLIRWSDEGDYTNFRVLSTDQAGSFRIPIGSTLRGGMAVQNQNMFWTDLDMWVANFSGFPLEFGFNKIGAGAGMISSHAMMQLRSGVYWMGPSNFYAYTGNGLSVIPCPVWDAVFQNLNPRFTANVRAMPNTPFNEVGWLYPSAASVSGECDSYVKFNITEQGSPWDIGPANTLPRSAWMDQTVIGNPLSASPAGIIYRQESTNDADGQPMAWSFSTGYFMIGDGEDYAFVDQVLPDFIWGTYVGPQTAQVQMSFNVVNYPGDTPTVYGPYPVTQQTEFISPRFRGRQMSFTVGGNDFGSFVRLGRVRYRWAPAGRR